MHKTSLWYIVERGTVACDRVEDVGGRHRKTHAPVGTVGEQVVGHRSECRTPGGSVAPAGALVAERAAGHAVQRGEAGAQFPAYAVSVGVAQFDEGAAR